MYLSVEKTGLFLCMYDYIQVLSGWIFHGCSNTEIVIYWFVKDRPWSYIINKNKQRNKQVVTYKPKWQRLNQGRTTLSASQDTDKDLLNNDLLLHSLLYQNEILAVIHDIRRDWRLPGLLCALLIMCISTSQRHICEVYTDSKRPERNAW